MSEQRWSLKRPMAEFVAIFAGVTLSLVADDWREARDDSRDEVAALELIHADLVRDTAELGFALRPIRRHEQATVWLLHRWEDPAVPTDSLMSALTRYVIYNSFDLQNAAYTSLKEANRLSLISNDSLRAMIVDYFDKRQVNTATFLDGVFREREKLLDLLSYHVRWPPLRDPESGWPWSGILRLVSSREDFVSDVRLPNQVQLTGAFASLALGLAEDALEENEALRSEIERELARR